MWQSNVVSIVGLPDQRKKGMQYLSDLEVDRWWCVHVVCDRAVQQVVVVSTIGGGDGVTKFREGGDTHVIPKSVGIGGADGW